MDTHTHTSLTPKFFFLSAAALVTLITTVTASLGLLFEALNHAFPDALNSVYGYGYNTYSFESMRASLATLIIVFPIFIVVTHFWNKESEKKLSKADSMVYKWVVYFILFLAGVVVIADLVTLVRYFVSGEITTRFILKVIGTFITAALVGSFYIYGLRSSGKKLKYFSLIYMGVSSILVLGLIIFSFITIGSPKDQRALRFDSRRVQDLQSIQSQVIFYWQQKEKLPATLSELATPISSYALPVDPEFEKGNVYEYRVINPLSFELCGTFSQPMPKGWQEYPEGGTVPMRDIAVSSSYPYGGGISNESFDHDAGRTCFTRTIDKDLYPPFPKDGKR
jgi:hypothetical protein